jgi:hypothetical protein
MNLKDKTILNKADTVKVCRRNQSLAGELRQRASRFLCFSA